METVMNRTYAEAVVMQMNMDDNESQYVAVPIGETLARIDVYNWRGEFLGSL